MFSKQFLIDTAERALATFLQTLLALVGTDALNILTLDWRAALAAAVSATVLSVVKSFAGEKVGNAGTASWSKATLPAPIPIRVDAVAEALVAAREALAGARRNADLNKQRE